VTYFYCAEDDLAALMLITHRLSARKRKQLLAYTIELDSTGKGAA